MSKQRSPNTQAQYSNYSLPRARPKVPPIIPFEESRKIYGQGQQYANTVSRASGFGIGAQVNPRTPSGNNLEGKLSRISVQDLRKNFDAGEPSTPNRLSFPKSPSTPSFPQYNNLRTAQAPKSPSLSLYNNSSNSSRSSTPSGTLPRSFIFPQNKHSKSPSPGTTSRPISRNPTVEKLSTPTGTNSITVKLKSHSKSFLINEDELPVANYSPPPPISPTIKNITSRTSSEMKPMQIENVPFATMPRNQAYNTPLYSVPNKPNRKPIPDSWNNHNTNIQTPTIPTANSSFLVSSSAASKKKSLYENKPSILLTYNENQQVFSILGHNRQTLSTAVVQIYLPAEYDSRRWKVRDIGVLCFVRDPKQRSYFLEILSLRMNRSILSQEIYEEFDYRCPMSKFLTFEGDMYCVGLSFANDTEAQHFKEILDQKISAKRKRRFERQSKVFDKQHQRQEQSGNNSNANYDLYNRNPTNHAPIGFLSPAPMIHTEVTLLSDPKGKSKKNKKAAKAKTKEHKLSKMKKGKLKIDKTLIGTPMNFQHVSHAGFDRDKGFTTHGVFDEKLYAELFKQAGVSKQQLEDPDTRKFIYEFVEDYERKSIKRPPPPPPSMTNTVKQVKPPPPTVPTALKNENTFRNNYSNLDDTTTTIVPPIQMNKHARPPPAPPMPPPPPPMPVGTSSFPPAPPPIPQNNWQESQSRDDYEMSSIKQGSDFPPELQTDTRSNLLEQIKQVDKGTLRKVDPNLTLRKPAGGLSDLLSEIRSGDGYKSLRKVEKSPIAERPLNPMDGLAGALARALAERSHAINPDSSDEDNGEQDSDEEWADD